MNTTDLVRLRMQRLRLSGPPLATPENVVRSLGAVQSQDYGPAKWSVAMRADGVDDSAMERAFADGAILRTHVLRPTWHFVLPEDILWMLRVTAPRVQAANAYRYRQLGLDDAELKRSSEVIAGALRGKNWLTRNELKVLLQDAGISAEDQRAPYMLMNAELNGLVCSGPLKGKQHTYGLIEERAPQARDLTCDEALAELTLRYFTGHGPATVKDLRSWSSLTIAAIKEGLEMVGSQLEHEVIDGLDFWSSASASPRSRVPSSPTIHLLQAYDEYFMGYSESRYVLVAPDALPPKTRAMFNMVVILDGRVAGSWKRTIKENSVTIQVDLHRPLDGTQTKALQAAADRHGDFVGLPARVLITRI